MDPYYSAEESDEDYYNADHYYAEFSEENDFNECIKDVEHYDDGEVDCHAQNEVGCWQDENYFNYNDMGEHSCEDDVYNDHNRCVYAQTNEGNHNLYAGSDSDDEHAETETYSFQQCKEQRFHMQQCEQKFSRQTREEFPLEWDYNHDMTLNLMKQHLQRLRLSSFSSHFTCEGQWNLQQQITQLENQRRQYYQRLELQQRWQQNAEQKRIQKMVEQKRLQLRKQRQRLMKSLNGPIGIKFLQQHPSQSISHGCF